MIKATVVIDNFCQRQGLLSEWGFSIYIETPDGNLLWDTGGICRVLEHNLRFLGIDPACIENIALSHGHFDHTSGLIDMIRLAPGAKLWASPEIGRQRWSDANAERNGGGGPLFQALPIHAVAPEAAILPDITAFTVPESCRDPRFVISTDMFEARPDGTKIPDTFADDISLLVQGKRGASLILGCAHAGLPNILGYVKTHFGVTTFDTITGGTHLCGATREALPSWLDALAEVPVRRWRVNHCTGFYAAAALACRFDDVDWAGAGTVLTF